jgi:hypothetical protein
MFQCRIFADQSAGRRRPRRQGRRTRERRPNDPAFEVASALYRMSGVDLTVLEGIDFEALLTDAQKKQWKEILGKPLDLGD